MERILVSMDARLGAWEAWSRAVALAKRIDAGVFALLVLPPSPPAGHFHGEHETARTRNRLEALIELAKSEGIRVDYFVSEGDYEEEVIRFVNSNKITLLVAESSSIGENRHMERDLTPIRKIRHRITCRVELVSPRKN